MKLKKNLGVASKTWDVGVNSSTLTFTSEGVHALGAYTL